jgi:hypothetical protein
MKCVLFGISGGGCGCNATREVLLKKGSRVKKRIFSAAVYLESTGLAGRCWTVRTPVSLEPSPQ